MNLFKKTKRIVKESFDIVQYAGKRLKQQADRSEKAVYKSFKVKK